MGISAGNVLSSTGLSLLLVACGPTINTGRIGNPVALPTGAPQSACEAKGWLELAPTRMVATGAVSSGLSSIHYSQTREGLALYRPGGDKALDIPAELPRFQEPDLFRDHMAPIEAVESASTRATVWALTGLVGIGVGLGIAAGVQEDDPGLAAGAGVGGVGIGLISTIISLIEQPSGYEQLDANAGGELFEPERDDLKAVVRGAHRANVHRRLKCGGTNTAPPANTQLATPQASPPTAPPTPAPSAEAQTVEPGQPVATPPAPGPIGVTPAPAPATAPSQDGATDPAATPPPPAPSAAPTAVPEPKPVAPSESSSSPEVSRPSSGDVPTPAAALKTSTCQT